MVKKQKTAQLGVKNAVPFSTNYASAAWYIDGVGIARNNRTYGMMYRRNVDIRACIREIQETTMKNGWELRKPYASKEGEKVVVDEKFQFALGTIKALKDQILKNLWLFANTYIAKRRDKVRRVIGYRVLDSRFVTIVTDENLTPLKYIYNQPILQGGIITYPADDILHWRKGEDFDNIVYGDSIMEALVVDVMAEEEANLSNYYYFQNDQIPSALYILKDNLTVEAQNDAMTQIRQALQGGHNKHKSIVADSVADIKTIRNDHNDADFIALRNFTTKKVCTAFGVPKTLLGDTEDVNHANGESQLKKFIEGTIEPWERELEQIFTALSKDFLGYDFVINSEHIDQIEQRSKLAIENVSNGLWTRNEARLYIGYEASDDELADELTVPTSAQLLSTLASAEPLVPQDPNTPQP